MKEKSNVKLWSKDFIIIIVVNFLVFLNHLMILSTFPFFYIISRIFRQCIGFVRNAVLRCVGCVPTVCRLDA